jgi:hypothetical protein
MKGKISKSPSYLVRGPYIFYFRVNVPRDLQALIGKKELRYSLKLVTSMRQDRRQVIWPDRSSIFRTSEERWCTVEQTN